MNSNSLGPKHQKPTGAGGHLVAAAQKKAEIEALDPGNRHETPTMASIAGSMFNMHTFRQTQGLIEIGTVQPETSKLKSCPSEVLASLLETDGKPWD